MANDVILNLKLQGADTAKKSLTGIGSTIASLTSGLFSFKGAIIAALSAFSVKKLVDDAVKLENSLIGLSSVAYNMGESVSAMTDSAKDLASDGLIPLTEVSRSLKNLLATGIGADKAVAVFKALREAAAFNRQGQLQLGDAVSRATDGFKNQLSMLVDNAGITRNLSLMQKDYAASLGKTIGQLTQREKYEAQVQGILKDALVFQGDYNKLLDTYSGAQSRVTGQLGFLSAELGQFITKSGYAKDATILFGDAILSMREYLKKNQNAIFQFIHEGVLTLKNAFSGLLTVLTTVLKVLNFFGPAVGFILDSFLSAVRDLTLALVKMSEIIAVGLIGAFNDLIGGAVKAVNALLRLSVVRTLLGKVGVDADELAQKIFLLTNIDASGTEKAFKTIKDGVTGVIGTAQDGVTSIVNFGKTAHDGLNGINERLKKNIAETPKLFQKAREDMRAEEIRKRKEAEEEDLAAALKAAKKKIKVNKEAFDKAFANPFQILFDFVPTAKAAELQKNFAAGFKTLIGVDIDSEFGNKIIGSAAGFVKSIMSGAKSMVVSITKGIGSFFGGNAFGELLGGIIDMFAQEPDKFAEMITNLIRDLPRILINVLINALATASGKIFKDGIIQLMDSLPMLVEALTTSIVETLANPIFWVDVAFSAIGAFVRAIPEMIQGFINGFKNAGNSIAEVFKNDIVKGAFTAIKDALAGIFGGIFDFFKGNIFEGFGEKIFNGFKSMFEKYNPVNLLSKIFKFDGGGKGVVEKFLGMDFPFVKFAKGGLVGGSSRAGGDSEINDIIPALLSAGEIVIPKSVVNSGFADIIKFLDSIGLKIPKFGFGGFVGNIVETITSGAGSAISAVGTIPGLSQLAQLGESLVPALLPKALREVFESLQRIGASINILDLVKNPKSAVENAVKSVTDSFLKPGVKKMLTPPKLEMGGSVNRVPSGFPNDSYPARLTSGELVIDRTLTNKLDSYLSSKDTSSETSITDVLLTKVINLLEQPLKTDAKIMIDQRTFADLILTLNRTNARLA